MDGDVRGVQLNAQIIFCIPSGGGLHSGAKQNENLHPPFQKEKKKGASAHRPSECKLGMLPGGITSSSYLI